MDAILAELFKLVGQGGAVIIALVILSAMVYGLWRFIIYPGMQTQAAMSRSNEEAAKYHADAAASNAKAAEANAKMSDANARTAGHLQSLTEMLLEAALRQND